MEPSHDPMRRGADEAALREFLAARDVPCPSCGYSLRGLTGERCPECNQRLMLRVGLAEPRIAAFIAGIVVLSMGGGFCTLLATWIAVMVVRDGGPFSLGAFPGAEVLFIGGPVLIAAMSILIRLRGQFSRLEPWGRWALVALAAMGTVATALIFFERMR